jgi:2Fe-2S ferredoxin
MTKVHITEPGGQLRIVDAGEGETLMKAATRNDVDGIVGECGGEMSCATCHVHVDSAWADRLKKPSTDELDLLEMSDDLVATSRLACQIKLTGDLDGLQVSVP